jgi:hypothetical protein
MSEESKELSLEAKEALLAAHLIKYNLYLLSKSVIFASILSTNKGTIAETVELTNAAIDGLDLVSKEQREQSVANLAKDILNKK